MVRVDEPAHLDCPLEWWFLHGWFQGPELAKRYFMTALFRFEVAGGGGSKPSAFAALVSVLPPAASHPHTSCWIDRAFLEASWPRGQAANNNSFLPKAALGELRKLGLPKGAACPEGAPVLADGALHFTWAGLELASCGSGVLLAFPDPSTQRTVRLHCTPESSRLVIDAARSVGDAEHAMEYATYPCMSLAGSDGESNIEGQGWFDHQWGGMAWLQSNQSPPRVRGWDWLGFTLPDRSAWMAALHWEARSREVFSRHLTVRNASGDVRVFRDFDWQPSRWWTSPTTLVRHPVEWRLKVPELAAELEFVPIADNQEIRIFGPMRAIWEGAGRVRGTLTGQPVDVAARLEGQGRGYVFGFQRFTRAIQVALNLYTGGNSRASIPL